MIYHYIPENDRSEQHLRLIALDLSLRTSGILIEDELGSVGYREPKMLQTQFLEYFARMRRIVHQHNVTSVGILVVHSLSVLSNEPKRDSPVATDLYRPYAHPISCESMKCQTWHIHVHGCNSGAATQYQTQP